MVVVGKDGKRSVLKKQTPAFNKKYMDKQKQLGKGVRDNNRLNINNTDQEDRKDNDLSNNTKILSSSAYSGDSILDNNTVVEEVIKKNNEIKREIIKEQEPKAKTIENFEYLPESIFEDVVIVDENSNLDKRATGVTRGEFNNVPNNNIRENNRISNNKPWWKFWEKDNISETRIDNDVIDDFIVNSNVDDSSDVVDDNVDMENVKCTDEIESNIIILNKDTDIRNAKRYTQDELNFNSRNDVVVEMNNIPLRETSNVNNYRSTNNKNIEFIEVDKKPWWKFWGNDKKSSNIRSNMSLEYDNLNDVPVEEFTEEEIKDFICEESGTCEQNKVIFKEEDMVEAKKLDDDQYKTEVKYNNQMVKNTIDLKKGKYYVQIISIKNEKNCKKVLDKYGTKGSNIVYPVNLNGTIYYRGIIGPFDTQIQADLEKERIIDMGYYDVFTFKER